MMDYNSTPVKEAPLTSRALTSRKKAKPNFSKPTEMVTFSVGDGSNREHFNVHRGKLFPIDFEREAYSDRFVCHYSPVLDAAFNSGFVEGQTQTYELDDTRPGAFRLFVQWLYSQDIDLIGPYNLASDAKSVVSNSCGALREGGGRESSTGDEDMGEDGAEAVEDVEEDDNDDDANGGEDDDASLTAYSQDGDRKFAFQDPVFLDQDMNLVHLWVLADKLLIPRLQNTAMRALRRMDQYYWSTHWIPYAWQHTAPGSPLRYLAIDLCSYTVLGTWQMRHPEHFPHSMLLELASGLLLESMQGNEYLHRRVVRDYLVDERDMVEDI